MRKRDLLILLAALTTAAVTAVGIFSGSALPTGAWGLSFRQEGAPPIGNAGIDQLKRYDAAYIGSTSEKVLYLTFDAGYENGCTEKILDTLQKHNVKAAFFLVGNYIEKNADLVRRMTEEGHIVGNHTMHHYDMSKISEKAAFTKELQDLETLYKDTTGQDMPKYYRPPQGIYSEENLRMAQELGYRTVFWSLAYVDWNNDSQPTREQALRQAAAEDPPRRGGAAALYVQNQRGNPRRAADKMGGRWLPLRHGGGTVCVMTGKHKPPQSFTLRRRFSGFANELFLAPGAGDGDFPLSSGDAHQLAALGTVKIAVLPVL